MSLPKFSVNNPVVVNLLMVAIIGGGAYCGFTLTREMFPETTADAVSVSTEYPGATPLEIEKSIAVKVEEAVKDLDGVDEINTTISEGFSVVAIKLTDDAGDLNEIVYEVKREVDALRDLPDESEDSVVAKLEPKLPVIGVAISGPPEEAVLKRAVRRLRDDLLDVPGITDVLITGTRKDELVVEVSQAKLLEYGLSFLQVAEAIRQANLDLPGGRIRTPGGNVAVRTLGETDQAERIAETIVAATPEGRKVRVRDLGRVRDTFEDVDIFERFNGERTTGVMVYKVGDQDAIDIATKVKALVAGKTGRSLNQQAWYDGLQRFRAAIGMPSEAVQLYREARAEPYPRTLTLALHTDLARFISDRLDLVRRSGTWGLAFVFLSLLFFLNRRVAFWVMMGLVVSVMGTMVMMSFFGLTINLLTLFGVIVVLGLIVDDAIVIGENIFKKVEDGMPGPEAAVRGAREVTWPVVAAVSTTIAAFLPLAFIKGTIGDFMGVLPIIVTGALAVSLIEALLILPCHLAESLRPAGSGQRRLRTRLGTAMDRYLWGPPRHFQQWVMDVVLARGFDRLIRRATRYRYVTVATAVGALVAAIGLLAGKRVEVVFFPKMDSEILVADLRMPVGTPIGRTDAAIRRIEQVVQSLPEVASYQTIVGNRVSIGESGASEDLAVSHVGQLTIELQPVERRDRTSEEILAQLRAATADIAARNELRFTAMQGGPGGLAIALEIAGRRRADARTLDPMRTVAGRVKAALSEYPGVVDITDDFEAGRPEVQLRLRDSARAVGMTNELLAAQIRAAFYGAEARTLVRDREDVKIRVRLPEPLRRSVHDIESLRIATPTGEQVPLVELAELDQGVGYTTIRHTDGRRVINVMADVDQAIGNPEEITAAMEARFDELRAGFPGVHIAAKGRNREAQKAFDSLTVGFTVALVLIYVILAWLFRSYTQPLMVMLSIPLGLVGAIVGHWVMGFDMMIMSWIGFAALAGIAVNDALVLVDYVNRLRRGGTEVTQAVIEGANRRLRPIMLTTLTTILGLAPLMAEQSFQARFLIPMAISITFGLAFATLLTLVVLPAMYLIGDDLRRVMRRAWYGPRAAWAGTVLAAQGTETAG